MISFKKTGTSLLSIKGDLMLSSSLKFSTEQFHGCDKQLICVVDSVPKNHLAFGYTVAQFKFFLEGKFWGKKNFSCWRDLFLGCVRRALF